MDEETLRVALIGAAAREAMRTLGLSGGRVVAVGHPGQQADGIFRVQDANERDVEVPEAVATALLKRINDQFGEPGSYRIGELHRGEGIAAAERPQRSEHANDIAYTKALVAWEKARGLSPGQR
jgi:hypothetical protein